MDTCPISARSLTKHYGIDGDLFERQYKTHLSGYGNWSQKAHATEYMVFPRNTGEYLCIDETALSNGELYTIITRMDAHGHKKALVAMIKGTAASIVSQYIKKIPTPQRMAVKEVTMDLSDSMRAIARECFPNARITIDRFHVQKLMLEAVQDVRIRHRWETLEEFNKTASEYRKRGETYRPTTLKNGDTIKELLARSRYLLYKSPEKWSRQQKQRAELLFDLFPDIKDAYWLGHDLRLIYSKTKETGAGYTKLAKWFNKVEQLGIKELATVAGTVMERYRDILNFFELRNTNAFAESFNAKLKSFRAKLNGVSDKKFFLFRIAKIWG